MGCLVEYCNLKEILYFLLPSNVLFLIYYFKLLSSTFWLLTVINGSGVVYQTSTFTELRPNWPVSSRNPNDPIYIYYMFLFDLMEHCKVHNEVAIDKVFIYMYMSCFESHDINMMVILQWWMTCPVSNFLIALLWWNAVRL